MTTDIPDLIAGALGVSRGTAYDMMREALAEQQEPLTDELILIEAARHLGEMHVENCGIGGIKDFARAIEAKLKAKNERKEKNT